MSAESDFAGSGPWDLPVHGFEVTMLWFAFPFSVFAYGEGQKHLRVMLAGPFEFRDDKGESLRIDPEKARWEEFVPLLALRYDKIKRATLAADSVLNVEYLSGRAITVGPSGGYAGFEALGPGFMIVGEPSGPAISTGKGWEQS